MNRISAFSSRNFKEIIRDPLSYIFCLGFPLVMLFVMTIVNNSIPPEANMTLFRIDSLAGGIAVFGLTFIMLFTCLTVAKDRSGAFLVRLYAAPMRSGDFILGYILPTSLLAVLQILITLAAAFAVSLTVDIKLNALGPVLTLLSLLPTVVMMISFGLLFGTLFSEKAAPGLCSIVISLASFLGGVWFDADGLGGVLLKICEVLPFYHAVKAARMASALKFDGFFPHFLMTLAYSVVITAVSVAAFKGKMKADLQ
ncbi:MAG: ABC transporter permease [Ruminococcaceae bacterium]|nr:ABC transporter permease [Oscillospiraceae bacterium]